MKRNVVLAILFAASSAVSACAKTGQSPSTTEGPSGPANEASVADEPAPAPSPQAHEETEAVAPAGGGEDLSGASSEELAERTLAYLGEIGQAAQAADGDCDQVAQNFEELAAKGTAGPLMAEMEKREATMSDEEKRDFEQKFAPRAQELMAPLMEVAMSCQDHQGVQVAMQKLMPAN